MMIMTLNIVIIPIILLSQFIQPISTIQCYTCPQITYHYCQLPLNLDAGDESNENEVDNYNYNDGFACMSDHSINPQTGERKIILRGIDLCEEIDIPNHRVHCCYTDNCNKQLPQIIMEIESRGYQHLSSLMLTSCFVILMHLMFFD